MSVFEEVPFSAFTRKLLTFSGLLGRHLDRFEDLYTSRTGEITYYGASVVDPAFKRAVFYVSQAVLDNASLAGDLMHLLKGLTVTEVTPGRHQIKVPGWDDAKCAKGLKETRTSQPLIERTSFADLLLITLRHDRGSLNHSSFINLIAKSSYRIQTVIEAQLHETYADHYQRYPELTPRRERRQDSALQKGTV